MSTRESNAVKSAPSAGSLGWVERGLVPDPLVRAGIRRLCEQRLVEIQAGPHRMTSLMSRESADELGLEPGGALGEGYLVPYGSTCQFIPGYRGLIALARRSGQIVSLEAHVVHQHDTFKIGRAHV